MTVCDCDIWVYEAISMNLVPPNGSHDSATGAENVTTLNEYDTRCRVYAPKAVLWRQ